MLICNTKQIFQTFLFNIRNYSFSVINIQRCEVDLNIILPRVNISILNKKGIEYLTPNKIREDKG